MPVSSGKSAPLPAVERLSMALQPESGGERRRASGLAPRARRAPGQRLVAPVQPGLFEPVLARPGEQAFPFLALRRAGLD
jgi:hypothetical protein